VLLYRQQDLGLRRFFASGGVSGDEIVRVARALRERRTAVRPVQLAETLPLSDTKLATAVQHLVQAGFAAVEDVGAVRAMRDGVDLGEAVEHAAEAEQHRQAFAETMRARGAR
jgi:ATP-dependent DNA helicase RecQ